MFGSHTCAFCANICLFCTFKIIPARWIFHFGPCVASYLLWLCHAYWSYRLCRTKSFVLVSHIVHAVYVTIIFAYVAPHFLCLYHAYWSWTLCFTNFLSYIVYIVHEAYVTSNILHLYRVTLLIHISCIFVMKLMSHTHLCHVILLMFMSCMLAYVVSKLLRSYRT